MSGIFKPDEKVDEKVANMNGNPGDIGHDGAKVARRSTENANLSGEEKRLSIREGRLQIEDPEEMHGDDEADWGEDDAELPQPAGSHYEEALARWRRETRERMPRARDHVVETIAQHRAEAEIAEAEQSLPIEPRPVAPKNRASRDADGDAAQYGEDAGDKDNEPAQPKPRRARGPRKKKKST